MAALEELRERYAHAPVGNIRAGGIGEVIDMIGHDAADDLVAGLEAENERLKEELGKAEHMLLRYVLAEIARALGDSGKETHWETT